MAKVAIIGSATWGTTLGIVLARNGVDVVLWCRTRQEALDMRKYRENRRFLPGRAFPKSMNVTWAQDDALSNADLVIFAVPSRSLRKNARRIKNALKGNPVIISAAKGLELDSGKRMSQVLEEELGQELSSRICVLSGPNLALEIVEGKPSSTVVASSNKKAAEAAQKIINSMVFRVYTNDDVVGVELGGALKNIIALGAGICDGMGYGDNAKAGFITRGLAEITRFGVAAGANPLTFAGLAGVGDLIATCSSPLSRNHRVGMELAQGRKLADIRASMRNVAEGIDTTEAVLQMAKELGVDMPISQTTYKVLYKGLAPEKALLELMERAPKAELETTIFKGGRK